MLSILRIVVALLFLQHGLSKLFGFPQPMTPPPLWTMEWFSGVIEFAGGVLLTLGLFTRSAAFIMSGEMAVGYFMFHAPRAFFPAAQRRRRRRSCTASSFCIWFSPVPGRGASTRCGGGSDEVRRIC